MILLYHPTQGDGTDIESPASDLRIGSDIAKNGYCCTCHNALTQHE